MLKVLIFYCTVNQCLVWLLLLLFFFFSSNGLARSQLSNTNERLTTCPVLAVHTSHRIIRQSCQTITSLLIKPKQQARQSAQTLLRAIKGSPAPPPSSPANRSATLWHTDIIAAERKQTRPAPVPTDSGLDKRPVHKAGGWGGGEDADRGPGFVRSPAVGSVRAPCHPDCKQEPQNGATAAD